MMTGTPTSATRRVCSPTNCAEGPKKCCTYGTIVITAATSKPAACRVKSTAVSVLAPVTPTATGTCPPTASTTVSTAMRRSSSVSV